jgi:formate dehydrogenase subunit delta
MSASSPERLVYMANQIAAFFASQPGDLAALHVAEHLTAFWDPRMRRMIVEHLDQHDGDGLAPAALEAVRLLKTASAKTVARALEAAGEPTSHQPGNDAG